MYGYVPLHSGIIGILKNILVHTGIYQSVPVHTSMYHYILDFNFAIQRIYEYVRVQTVPNRLKKGATRLEPAILCMLFCRIYPFSSGSDLNAGLKAMKESMNTYIVTVNLLVCAPGA